MSPEQGERGRARSSRTPGTPPPQRTPAEQTPDWTHQTTLPAEPTSASRARAFVSRHLAEHRLLHLVDPVRLAASELATNALVHQTEFTITLSEVDELVLLSVRDGSLTASAGAVPEPRGTVERGLRIVALVSLDWGVSRDAPGSRTVWASFPRRPRHDGPPS